MKDYKIRPMTELETVTLPLATGKRIILPGVMGSLRWTVCGDEAKRAKVWGVSEWCKSLPNTSTSETKQ